MEEFLSSTAAFSKYVPIENGSGGLTLLNDMHEERLE